MTRFLTAIVVAALVTVAPAPAKASAVATPFDASFRGTFTITFFTGPGATHELRFHGSGRALGLGASRVDGAVIHGTGTYAIVAGTGRLAGATGTGSVRTEAQVTGLVIGGVTGTFDPLVFEGTSDH